MWSAIELRELRVFLALAEELHFGRAADQLDLSQSRVSQVLRALERKLGGQLVHRTSRRVALTPLGERFLADVQPAYGQLTGVLERAYTANRSLAGTLRLGLLYGMAGGPHWVRIVDTFEVRHPHCDVQVSELPYADVLGPLRRGELDLIAMRLPLQRDDLVVGPTLSREPRVLAVSRDHPLAGRERISIEDVAEYRVLPFGDLPAEMVEELMPQRTPSGRPIRRLDRLAVSPHEIVGLVARGRIVHPTVPSFAEHFGHPDIVQVPIFDLRPSRTALVWRRRDPNPRLREFISVAREVLRYADRR